MHAVMVVVAIGAVATVAMVVDLTAVAVTASLARRRDQRKEWWR